MEYWQFLVLQCNVIVWHNKPINCNVKINIIIKMYILLPEDFKHINCSFKNALKTSQYLHKFNSL